MSNKEALRQSYKILSPFSDKQRWEFNNNLVHLNFLTKYLDKSRTIFDAGCGIGILALALTLLGYKVEGGDKYLFTFGSKFAVDDIEKLRTIWKKYNLRISEKDILTDEISQKYDAIISIATIEHQRNPKLFLEKLKNAVKDGGHIYIATPNISHLLNRARFLFGLSPMSGHLKQWFEQGENFTGHFREYTLSELRQMSEWSGLQIVVAKNVQSMRPNIKSGLRAIYMNLFRLLSFILPGAGDTNLILCKK
ncbi:hypothetical protein COT99_00035 [Candidatus Falkowbacteria bacterium CG10_big_fil_rev_8_21_14_0_10_43_10]|uniref:Methyltransferase domain-containing protein n=1 Tax=Candidatus Falkowbacteria bacterium CG10_big_fil_rev_8_21_14_0_10_43_10 TaxID=1974567 RepID=A0A2H0V3A3_9BACT|nr:MAG: hypothetical protein COT99_00035 [Candidatus Falkowbacteria bacterium CG10_big_fil_rev_8_21_14_0_10_43_10]